MNLILVSVMIQGVDRGACSVLCHALKTNLTQALLIPSPDSSGTGDSY
jgi:hypothetical protein